MERNPDEVVEEPVEEDTGEEAGEGGEEEAGRRQPNLLELRVPPRPAGRGGSSRLLAQYVECTRVVARTRRRRRRSGRRPPAPTMFSTTAARRSVRQWEQWPRVSPVVRAALALPCPRNCHQPRP